MIPEDDEIHKQDELTPQTLDANSGHIESRETMTLDLRRFSMHLLNEKEV